MMTYHKLFVNISPTRSQNSSSNFTNKISEYFANKISEYFTKFHEQDFWIFHQQDLWILHQQYLSLNIPLNFTNPTVAMDKTAYSGKLLQTFNQSQNKQFVLKILQTTAPKLWDLVPIPTKLLHENHDILATVTNIINTSPASDPVPPDFKTAIVKPLLKKTSLDHANLLKKLPSNLKPTISDQNVVLERQSNTHASTNTVTPTSTL